jgi:opacity protein-like surface antigen
MRRTDCLPALTAAVLALALCLPAQAAKLVREYTFKETLKDGTGSGPDIEARNGLLGNGVYTFGAGQGLHLAKTGVTDHYTIELTFKFDDTAEWQKIIDFKNRTSDNGLYILEGQLQFYEFGIGGQFQAGQEYRVRLERDKNTNVVKGYVNDAQAFEFSDPEGHAIFQDEGADFFLDDSNTMGEESGGAVTRIRIWDEPGQK